MTYEKVPNIITGKDLDYLNDMFNWNYIALKKTNNDINNVQNEEIKNLMTECSNIFNTNLSEVIQILGGTNE